MIWRFSAGSLLHFSSTLNFVTLFNTLHWEHRLLISLQKTFINHLSFLFFICMLYVYCILITKLHLGWCLYRNNHRQGKPSQQHSFDPQQTGFKGNLRLLIKPFEQPHLPFKILSAALLSAQPELTHSCWDQDSPTSVYRAKAWIPFCIQASFCRDESQKMTCSHLKCLQYCLF